MRNYCKYLFHIPLPSPLSKFFLQKEHLMLGKRYPYLCSLNRHIRNYFQEELAFLHSCCSQASHSALQLYHSGFSTEFFLIFKRDISLKKKKSHLDFLQLLSPDCRCCFTGILLAAIGCWWLNVKDVASDNLKICTRVCCFLFSFRNSFQKETLPLLRRFV